MVKRKCPPGYRIQAIAHKDYVWIFRLRKGNRTIDYFRSRIAAVEWAWMCYQQKRD